MVVCFVSDFWKLKVLEIIWIKVVWYEFDYCVIGKGVEIWMVFGIISGYLFKDINVLVIL